MSTLEKIQAILDRFDGDLKLAAEHVYQSEDHELCIAMIALGLGGMASRNRRNRRRELKRQIAPEYTRTTMGPLLTPLAKRRLLEHTRELLGDDGWKIGKLYLRDLTREDLLMQAEIERQSASGHIENATFYEALAEPMGTGQRVGDYWTVESARALRDQHSGTQPSAP